MPVPIKPYQCIMCNEKEPNNFYGGRKTLCKKCSNKPKNIYSKDIKDKLVKPFLCEICSQDDITNFYVSNKSKCKKCIATKTKEKKEITKYVKEEKSESSEDE